MLEEKIFNDYKKALKSKDTMKSQTLSFLRANLKNLAIEKRKEDLEDDEVITVIKRLIKQEEESISQFKQGQRADLAEKETKALEISRSYLPPQLSPEAIKEVIEEIITSCGAKDIKDMGRVMKEVMAKIGTQADGRIVSELVKTRLTKEG